VPLFFCFIYFTIKLEGTACR